MPEIVPNKDRKYVMLAFRIIGEFGAVIAVPVVVLALLGKHLDERFGTGPWLRAAGFVLAAIITSAIIYRRAKHYGKEYAALDKKEEPNKE